MRSITAGRTLLLLITLLGCQKGDIQTNDPPDPPPPAPITAELIIPEGSILRDKLLTVTNGKTEAPVISNVFTIDTNGTANSFSFVTDADNKLYLAKYYDGKSDDHDISPHSTALALIMSTPIAGSLTAEGRASLTEFITSTSEFERLENEIKDNILQGQPLLDTSNTTLTAALLAAFEKTAATGTSGDTTSAIIVERTGRNVKIKNNGAAISYVVAVYKDGERTGDFTILPATQRHAPSVSQAESGVYDPHSSSEQKTIELSGAGSFDLRIRSGNTATEDASEQNHLAARVNMIDMAWSIANKFMRSNEGCMKDIRTQMVNNYQFDVPSMNGSLNEMSNDAFSLAGKIIADNIGSTAGCFNNDQMFPRYSAMVISFVNYLGFVSRNATGSVNVNPLLNHLYFKQQQFNFCYKADETNITECENVPVDTFVYYAFHAVPGTTIGATIELRLRFNGTDITGTATSQSFDFGSNEPTVPVSGTLSGNTMTLFIHTDNGVVPDLVDCIPQPAPNCATCRYTGDHVVQDWVITGTVNDDHSTYIAEYNRKYIYTSLLASSECSTRTVVDEVEEDGLLSY